MISNIRATFGSIIRLGQCCRMCFKPLAIYTMSFRPFPMFARLYLTYCYIDGLSMHSQYYTILIWCVPDPLPLCFDFIYLWRYQYPDVSIIYSFGWLYYYYRFRLRSLRTISSIRSFWHHFDLSEVIFTYIYIALSFYTTIILYCIPPPSWDFVLLWFGFDFVPLRFLALYLAHRPRYASFYLTPLIICCFSLHFINFTPILLNILLYMLNLVYRPPHSYTDLPTHLHSLSDHFQIRYWHLYW
jgi:hypothetical protein